MTIDLNPSNRALYAGCRVTRIDESRYRLDTPLGSAVLIVAANLLEIIKGLPPEDRDELVIIGGAPDEIYGTVLLNAQPHFNRLVRVKDGGRSETVLPQPPDDFQIEREDEG